MSKLAMLGGTPVVSRKTTLPKMFREYPLTKRFAEYVGVPYALPVGSGTAAILSALLGAGVEPGDEVLTVSHTWFCTVTSILQVGAVPVFVDVDPDTFMMDPAKIEERITPRTKAILAVSLYGQPADYERILPIARKHGLVVIDDACQSVGAGIGTQKLGAIADITAFSFSGKPIVSTGGGMVTTANRTFYERAMLGGQHPSFISTQARDESVWRFASTGGYGLNSRLDGKCAERAYEQLLLLDVINDHRRANAHALARLLEGVRGITLPRERKNAHHVFHMFTSLFDSSEYGITRNEFVDALNAEGVPTLTYISSANFLKDAAGNPVEAGPLHRRHLFQELARTGRCGPFRFPEGVRPDYSAGSLPVTERLVDLEFNFQQRCLNPPFDVKTMGLYAEAITKVLDSAGEIRDARNKGALPRRDHNFLVAYESDA
ncbi:MAG TPA: DegT/DnrJ/EryC1/StrS family aminotransferase [Archangium sp.]|jgi:dTDP-4-amino-4,6-dideoxygalactose transaminase|uniref:DegT/DnrJ/EryC1/StrS family aminotransferase n=1 Tax=Archangium sp. TaxID=1872627 RepID=UPI002ED99A6A